MLLDPIAKSPSYEIEDASGFQMSDSQYQSDIQSTTGKPKTKTAYNIDLFSTGQEEQKPKGKKKSKDVEMQEEGKTQKRNRKQAEEESDGSGDDSSSSSGSNSSSSDSNENETPAKSVTEHIEVPVSVVQRFFSKREVLTNYLLQVNQDTTFALLDVSPSITYDLCFRTCVRRTNSKRARKRN